LLGATPELIRDMAQIGWYHQRPVPRSPELPRPKERVAAQAADRQDVTC
jgi:hypothetical protein